MAVECASASRPVNVLQIRTGGLPSGQNVQFTDQGIVDICNSGQADANIEIGEIWFIYDVAFLKPIPSAESGGNNLSDHFQILTATSSANLGTASLAVSTNAIGGKINAAGTAYVFPSYIDSGSWLFVVNLLGGAATASGPTVTITGGTESKVWSSATVADNASQVMAPQATLAACTEQMFSFIVNVTAPNCNVGFTGCTLAGTTGGDLMVTSWDANIITLVKNRIRWRRYFEEEDRKAQLRQSELDNAVSMAVRNVLESAGAGDLSALSRILAWPSREELIARDYCSDEKGMPLRRGPDRVLDPCFFCGDERPDHFGRDCPRKPPASSPTIRRPPPLKLTEADLMGPTSPISIEHVVMPLV